MTRRQMLLALGALAGCAGSAAEPGAGTATPAGTGVDFGPPADLILFGGPILTMDPDRPTAQALAVRGDRIAAVGRAREVMLLASDRTALVDLEGAALLPGFVDAHSHFFGRADAAGTDVDGISDYILSLGITTAAELFVDQDLLAELRRLEEEGRLGVRLSAYLAANNACGDPLDDWWAAHPPTRNPGEMLRIGGVKVYSDGGACHTPAVSYEYANGGGHGDLYFTATQLSRLVKRIEAAGHQAAIHALGDRAVETVLDALDSVIRSAGNTMRHRIEHSAATRPDLRARHGEIGAVVTLFGAFQTCFFTEAAPGFQFRTPEQYWDWEWPWRSLIDASPGAHFGWHADFPVFPSSRPIDSLYGFVTRSQVSADGSICEPTRQLAAGAITIDEALALMTTGSAYALFRDEEVGRLAPDLLADLVVLSADPTAVRPADLPGIEVWMTMVGGVPRWCAEGHAGLCGT